MTHEVSFVIKRSKTGFDIPVVEGIHLHSVYDPIKEANDFALENADKILKSNKILILGLGFGYHIRAINDFIQSKKHDVEILIVEPSKKTYDEFIKNIEDTDLGPTRVFAGCDIQELYRNWDFVDFLSDRPTVIPHIASFNHYKDYFSKLMSYEVSNKISNISSAISNNELNDELKGFKDNTLLREITLSKTYESDFELISKLIYKFGGQDNEH